MREQLLIKMNILINERLEEINMSHYDSDLNELHDPVIDVILELRKMIFVNPVKTNNCFLNFLD